MPSKQVLLAAFIAPGSVEAALGKVQAAIFDEHGFASAQALPPIIPLAFPAAVPNARELLRELNLSVPSGWRMRLTAAAWKEGHLYAGVESAGAWAAVRSRALELCGPEADGMFPVAEGFYLGCGDAPPECRPRIMPAVPGTSFSSCTIALVGLRADPSASAWWSDVGWEILHERPFRGRKEQ